VTLEKLVSTLVTNDVAVMDIGDPHASAYVKTEDGHEYISSYIANEKGTEAYVRANGLHLRGIEIDMSAWRWSFFGY